WEALAPYIPGDSLHFALSYEGTIAAGAFPDQPEETTVTGGWPASFDPQRPDTWGEASTEKPPHILYLPLLSRQGAGQQSEVETAVVSKVETGNRRPISSGRAEVLRIQQPEALAGGPRPAPTANDFYKSCPGSPGDPAWNTADVIEKIKLAEKLSSYAFDEELKWPQVDPQNYPIVQAEGTLNKVEISHLDSPVLHTSHDLDMRMSLLKEYRWLSLFTDENGHTLSGGPNLVLETESKFITYRAFPVSGDHVTVKGRWIFDCGHDPKTEIHPIPIFETDRLLTLPDGIGIPGHLKTVRVAHIWMNSNPHPWTYDLSALTPFTFEVQWAQSGYGASKIRFYRVLVASGGAASANDVVVTGVGPNTVQFTITPPGSTGQYYYEVILGYLDAKNPTSASGALHHVSLDAIKILDDHDDGAPDCVWNHDCGEWTMAIAVNNDWRRIWFQKWVLDVDDDNLYALSNMVVPIAGDASLSLRVIGYENDDWNLTKAFEFPGDHISTSPQDSGWLLGSPSSLCCSQHTKTTSDWQLYYTVHQGYDGPTALPLLNGTYWAFRLADEPNDDDFMRIDLGTLPVPDEGALPHLTEYSSYITQSPLQKNGVHVLSNDVDRYQFALDEFANVSFGPLPPGVHIQVEETFPWYYSGSLPQNLVDMIGYKSAWLKVYGDQPAVTDQQYTLKVYTTWRTLPPDWGEDQEQGRLTPHGGRLVDLVTPDPAATVIHQWGSEPERRHLTKDWAWQHVQEDIDYYDVWIPPVQTRPPGQPACKFDRDGKLEIRAYDMHLRAGTSHLPGDVVAEADNSITLTNLNTQFPDTEWSVAPMPLSPDGNEGNLLFQNAWGAKADTEYPNAAALLVLFLTSPANQRPIAESGFALPTHMSLLNDSDFLASLDLSSRVLLAGAATGQPFFYGEHNGEVIGEMGNALNAIWLGEKDIQTALDDAVAAVNEIVSAD
ncbi:MAG: hypothetical protein D6791_15900, partial [Chloroflexi bacterium]